MTIAAIRRGSMRVSTGAALSTAVVLCLLLLPVISMTDDLLENQQAAHPLAAQSWHLASEGASVGVEAVSLVSTWLFVLAILFASSLTPNRHGNWDVRRYAAWLARAQRLRPPPSHAL